MKRALKLFSKIRSRKQNSFSTEQREITLKELTSQYQGWPSHTMVFQTRQSDQWVTNTHCQSINRPDSPLHNTTSHTQCLYLISRSSSSREIFDETKCLHTQRGKHYYWKAKSIYLLYSSYDGGIIMGNTVVGSKKTEKKTKKKRLMALWMFFK